MPYFAIVSFDIADSQNERAEHQAEHRARLVELQDQDRLLTAGPLLHTDTFGQIDSGSQGSLIVASFETLDEARQWANVDPYNANGVYLSTDVYPYKAVYG